MTHTQVNDVEVAADALRWVRVGRDAGSDSFRAGAAAGSMANGRDDASLYVVSAGHRHDHEQLMAGVASVAHANATVVGCTTGGEVSVGGPTDDGVVVMAVGGSGISTATRCADIVGGDLRTAGEQVADAIWDIEDRGHTVLLLLSDGLAGDQQEVVRGAYSTVGESIPLVGGCAGGGESARTVLFHATSSETRVGGNQVIGVAISSSEPLGIGLGHGWTTVGDPVVVTKSTGNVILTIDDEPALDRFLRLSGAPADLADDSDSFSRFASIHPIRIAVPSGDEMRYICSADPIARSITSSAEVPQGVAVQAMEGTEGSVLDATDVAYRDALSQLNGPPLAVLAFDSIARSEVMGIDSDIDEVHRLEERIGAPVAGFSTYGEFARVAGASGFHHQSLVTLAIG